MSDHPIPRPPGAAAPARPVPTPTAPSLAECLVRVLHVQATRRGPREWHTQERADKAATLLRHGISAADFDAAEPERGRAIVKVADRRPDRVEEAESSRQILHDEAEAGAGRGDLHEAGADLHASAADHRSLLRHLHQHARRELRRCHGRTSWRLAWLTTTS